MTIFCRLSSRSFFSLECRMRWFHHLKCKCCMLKQLRITGVVFLWIFQMACIWILGWKVVILIGEQFSNSYENMFQRKRKMNLLTVIMVMFWLLIFQNAYLWADCNRKFLWKIKMKNKLDQILLQLCNVLRNLRWAEVAKFFVYNLLCYLFSFFILSYYLGICFDWLWFLQYGFSSCDMASVTIYKLQKKHALFFWGFALSWNVKCAAVFDRCRHLGLALNVSSWCWCLSFLGLVLCFQIWGQGDWMGIYTFWSFIYWPPQDSKKKLFVEVAAIKSSLWGGVVSVKTSRSCSEFPTRWFLLVYYRL